MCENSSHHTINFEPNTNKGEIALADLMASIEPEVVACVNRYIKIWQETGRIGEGVSIQRRHGRDCRLGQPESNLAAHCSGIARSLIGPKLKKQRKDQQINAMQPKKPFYAKPDSAMNEIKVNLPLDNRVAWVEDANGIGDYMVAIRFPQADVGRKSSIYQSRKQSTCAI